MPVLGHGGSSPPSDTLFGASAPDPGRFAHRIVPEYGPSTPSPVPEGRAACAAARSAGACVDRTTGPPGGCAAETLGDAISVEVTLAAVRRVELSVRSGATPIVEVTISCRAAATRVEVRTEGPTAPGSAGGGHHG